MDDQGERPNAERGWFLVQRVMCNSCIYRCNNDYDAKAFEQQIADPHMEGYFLNFRACHHAHQWICCHGFWKRHKNHFQLGQLAQRLKVVKYVIIDKWRNEA